MRSRAGNVAVPSTPYKCKSHPPPRDEIGKATQEEVDHEVHMSVWIQFLPALFERRSRKQLIALVADGTRASPPRRHRQPDLIVIMRETCFVPSVQIGRALNQPREGAVLGLAISKALAEAMGGTLTATSEVGVGARSCFGCDGRGEGRQPYSPPQ